MADKVYPRSCKTVEGKISSQDDASDKICSGVSLCGTCRYLF